MNLSQLFKSKNYQTDKNSVHSYIDNFYNDLFFDKKNATNILEVGVYGGGSILLWRDYFENAQIDAIDVNDCSNAIDNNRINHIVANAYDFNLLDKLNKYDIIIDDGPHTLESMIFFIENYTKLLKSNGIAIIEDIQDYAWFDYLIKFIPSNFTYNITDLRSIKNRYDDMLLTIRKN
jgi:hypothetical protein